MSDYETIELDLDQETITVLTEMASKHKVSVDEVVTNVILNYIKENHPDDFTEEMEQMITVDLF